MVTGSDFPGQALAPARGSAAPGARTLGSVRTCRSNARPRPPSPPAPSRPGRPRSSSSAPCFIELVDARSLLEELLDARRRSLPKRSESSFGCCSARFLAAAVPQRPRSLASCVGVRGCSGSRWCPRAGGTVPAGRAEDGGRRAMAAGSVILSQEPKPIRWSAVRNPYEGREGAPLEPAADARSWGSGSPVSKPRSRPSGPTPRVPGSRSSARTTPVEAPRLLAALELPLLGPGQLPDLLLGVPTTFVF